MSRLTRSTIWALQKNLLIEDLNLTRRPLKEAIALSGQFYQNVNYLHYERKQVFSKNWFAVGLARNFQTRVQYETFNIGSHQYFLRRGRSGLTLRDVSDQMRELSLVAMNGILFANHSVKANDIRPELGALEPLLGSTLNDPKHSHSEEYVVNACWKLVNECFLNQSKEGQVVDSEGPCKLVVSRNPTGLSVYIFPNVFIQLTQDTSMISLSFPEGPTSTRIRKTVLTQQPMTLAQTDFQRTQSALLVRMSELAKQMSVSGGHLGFTEEDIPTYRMQRWLAEDVMDTTGNEEGSSI